MNIIMRVDYTITSTRGWYVYTAVRVIVTAVRSYVCGYMCQLKLVYASVSIIGWEPGPALRICSSLFTIIS